MAPVQVRNNVECCSYSQEKFKLVKWSLLVTLETQTPYFEKSFKVEEDCECHLQGQIFKTMEWQSIGMWKNTEFNNISHKIFIDEMLIYHDIKVFNCKSFLSQLIDYWNFKRNLLFISPKIQLCVQICSFGWTYICVLHDKTYLSIVKPI